MDVHFQKSIFGILVPNGPLIEVLPNTCTLPIPKMKNKKALGVRKEKDKGT